VTSSAPPGDDRTRWRLRMAAGVCLAEAAALLVMAIIEIATLASDRLVVGITTTVFFLGYAIGLALAAVGLARAHSWARAPLMLSQLIQLGLAWSFHGPGTDWVAVLLAGSAAVVAVVLILPSTTTTLYGGPRAGQPIDHT
jgi:hypothetical protein